MVYTKDGEPISKAIVMRLPVYYRALRELKEKNVFSITSEKLAKRLGFTSSQIRQDLNIFGNFGKQGSGYEVDKLLKDIGDILHIEKKVDMVLIGAGKLGQSLMEHELFNKFNFNIVAAFDIDPDKIGKKINGIEIRDMDTYESYMDEHNIWIAVISVPDNVAQATLERVDHSKVYGIWNFAYVDYISHRGKIVENSHMSDALIRLGFAINNFYGFKKK